MNEMYLIGWKKKVSYALSLEKIRGENLLKPASWFFITRGEAIECFPMCNIVSI